MSQQVQAPDSTAVRVALWRAMHVLIDPPPHVLEDEVGLKLAAPDEGWRNRPDMHPQGTSRFRASIVARARFIEDLVVEQADRGVGQYVILGAGLDTFAQRHPKTGSKLRIFEVDKPGTQAWKIERLRNCGFEIPRWLRFVPVDFEADASWKDPLVTAGFDPRNPALVTSIGVSMYLTRDAILDMLRETSALAPGSTFVMTFLLPLDRVDAEDRMGYEMAMKGARASGTPFISFFTPEEMLSLAKKAGFKRVSHTSTAHLTQKYFSGRTDGLRPSTGEEILVAGT